MYTVSSIDDLRTQIGEWRKSGQRVALVPTMGNLHAGHYSLVEIARAHANKVVTTVFVNPTQFAPNEDFSRYPRTLEQDSRGLKKHGCDLLYTPETDQIYPFGIEQTVYVQVPGLGEILDGASRPGHFTGVATVVTKLFNLVAPDIAVFGQKDYQQLLVIRRLTRDLGLPIEIATAPIVRETNGLARSSRNQYLSDAQRTAAAVIYQTLRGMAEKLVTGTEIAEIEATAQVLLKQGGLEPDYAVLRNASDLTLPSQGQRNGLVALIAGYLGTTRLIDNLLIPDA